MTCRLERLPRSHGGSERKNVNYGVESPTGRLYSMTNSNLARPTELTMASLQSGEWTNRGRPEGPFTADDHIVLLAIDVLLMLWARLKRWRNHQQTLYWPSPILMSANCATSA